MTLATWRASDRPRIARIGSWNGVRKRRVMHDDEWTQLTECFDCGAIIAAATDRSYALSPEETLCFACAVRRGGVFDESEDRWTVAPDVRDEPDERRAHA